MLFFIEYKKLSLIQEIKSYLYHLIEYLIE